MKKINIAILMVLGFLISVSCDSDRDSNPTLMDPTEFVLNIPPYVSSVYDLENSSTIEFTCSQPDYGFTAATDYVVQISLTGEFIDATDDEGATYQSLSTIFTTARINVDAQEFAAAIVALSGIESEEEFYTEPIKVYIRIKASVTIGGLKPIVSNVIELPKVLAYYALDPVTMPANMYMIGSFNEWEWSKSYAMVPVHSTPGKFWRIVYFEKDAELKFNYSKSWDGTDFGYEGTAFPTADFAGIEDKDGNILITKAGWYIVVVTTEIVGRDYKYTVDFYAPEVYLLGNVIGNWDIVPGNLFTVPSTVDGEFISPTFIADASADDGGVRACIKLPGQEWWHTEFMVFDGKIEYRGTGDDQDRVVGVAGKKVYLNFTEETGSVK